MYGLRGLTRVVHPSCGIPFWVAADGAFNKCVGVIRESSVCHQLRSQPVQIGFRVHIEPRAKQMDPEPGARGFLQGLLQDNRRAPRDALKKPWARTRESHQVIAPIFGRAEDGLSPAISQALNRLRQVFVGEIRRVAINDYHTRMPGCEKLGRETVQALSKVSSCLRNQGEGRAGKPAKESLRLLWRERQVEGRGADTLDLRHLIQEETAIEFGRILKSQRRAEPRLDPSGGRLLDHDGQGDMHHPFQMDQSRPQPWHGSGALEVSNSVRNCW